MNNISDISKQDLEKMADAYFNCNLSAAQERILIRILSSLPDRELTPTLRQTLAVMSLSRLGSRIGIAGPSDIHPSKIQLRRKRKVFIAAAAACGVIALTAIAAIAFKYDRPADECYAYLDGNLVTDKQLISSIVASQLSDLDDARSQINDFIGDELAGMALAIENNRISTPPDL